MSGASREKAGLRMLRIESELARLRHTMTEIVARGVIEGRAKPDLTPWNLSSQIIDDEFDIPTDDV